jgi:indolepyruvate ferredoxin oxidoreductase, alpha subunit
MPAREERIIISREPATPPGKKEILNGDPNREIPGSEALALGALDAGVQYVTGYPGSPSTETFEALLDVAGEQVRCEWATNEKSAFDAAVASSLAGLRSLVCLKSVGLNVALDSLMVANLAPGDASLVLLTGDDPGGWGSQNEQDSRPLVAAAEIPLLEPLSAAEARAMMSYAFSLSERHRVPVAVRVTRALSDEPAGSWQPPLVEREPGIAHFQRQGDRFNVLPVHVVEFHQRLLNTLARVGAEFEDAPWNRMTGQGRRGIIAAGHAYRKLADSLEQAGSPPLRVLALSTLHPLPVRKVTGFLHDLDAALVLEETTAYVEVHAQAMAQRVGMTLPILGRTSGHLPGAGELFTAEIGRALAALMPEVAWAVAEPEGRPMPSRQALCDDCPYIPTLEALQAVMERHGGRQAFVVTGETGCMVRAQLPPWQILDVKYGMGSSIGLGAGLARAGLPQRIVALSGDSALLHSGLAELIDAVQGGSDLLIILLANETTALSGGQPHPATPYDARGRSRRPLDIVAMIRATGVASLHVVDPEDREVTEAAIEAGLAASGPAVVVARRPCPRYGP